MNTDLINTDKNKTNTTNQAGGVAYQLSSKQALAQLVNTGTLNHTFYANAQDHLSEVLDLAKQVDSEFLAKLAIYARKHSHMKDMPVLLLAILSNRDDGKCLFELAFSQVIDNGKQLRNFVQIMRSGVTGRKSLGSLPKKMVNGWLTSANDYRYVSASIGNTPTLKDVLKMTHPKPEDARQEALFKWTLDKEFDNDNLPELVQQLLAFQADNRQPLPDVPFQLLMALPLTDEHWQQIASQGSWQMLRMNLNTFARHGVFKVAGMAERIAETLTDPQAIAKSRVFPYQLFTTWSALNEDVPEVVKDALRTAMNTALANVPSIAGNVVVAVDVSWSMSSPATGHRRGATSKLRCVDVASLFASAIYQVNPHTRIIPFNTQVLKEINQHTDKKISVAKNEDSSKSNAKTNDKSNDKTNAIDVFKTTQYLSSFLGGGTAISAPLVELNKEKADVDVMIYFSDNESWADQFTDPRPRYGSTGLMKEWEKLKKRCPNAKLICVDIQPYTSSQALERKDILNIGGFSDTVFQLIDWFCQGKLDGSHWVNEIEKIEITDKQTNKDRQVKSNVENKEEGNKKAS
ncbi:TROVE domain-containing protein [Psychrobacter sp. I-STPA10]|uniref:TROVE domain-containing protein n=1 Tax=Psychrobacter sp. I-STPA10 TaxID=2585769 RepID=UPI001E4DBC66|nr:TROVE domain-containing protein [Psychrobacter sp. I-STPA10]